jgi:hypothetical protein
MGPACGPATAEQADHISLAGQWQFQLDRADAGVQERWFERSLDQRIKLPGALQNQGFGDDITVDTKWNGDVNVDAWLKGPQYAKYRQPGNIKVPFFLQPEKHYAGAAWYRREVEIPAAWRGKRVVLRLERPHWETRVWLDRREIGTNTSLSTPHSYDLGAGLEPGKHTLTIQVDNRMIVNVGPWAHSVTDHTQGNWNGMVGALELLATSPVWIEDVQVYPNVARKSALVKVQIGNASGKAGQGTLAIGQQSKQVDWDEKGGAAELEVALGRVQSRPPKALPPAHRRTGRRPAHSDLRPSRDRSGGQAVQAEWPPGLLPRHAGVLHLPAHGLPTDRCAVVEAHHRYLQVVRAEPDPLSLLVPAGSGVYCRRRAGLLFPG